LSAVTENQPGSFEGVIAFFDDADPLKDAVTASLDRGFTSVVSYSPLPDEESLEVLHPRTSDVRWTALCGALFGLGVGWAMTVWMSQDYPLLTGGKPLVSWQPFAVSTFEITALFTSIFTVIGFLAFARLPRQYATPSYRPRFAVDRFALYLPCEEESDERTGFETLMHECEAVAVIPSYRRPVRPARSQPG
jgi:hypothetical protein